MEDLQNAINEDLATQTSADKEKQLNAFERMSKANLQKQDKKLLLEFAENKGLLKGLTDRQKERLNRKEIADLIKGGNSTQKAKETAQNETINNNPLEEYQDAIITAINGDYARLDSLAFKNVNGFLIDGAQSLDELDERTIKKIKLAKFGASAVYLIIKFTGGVSAWKTRVLNVVQKIKDKRKKKTNV